MFRIFKNSNNKKSNLKNHKFSNLKFKNKKESKIPNLKIKNSNILNILHNVKLKIENYLEKIYISQYINFMNFRILKF